MQKKAVKTEEEIDIKNFKFISGILTLIVITGVTFFITKVEWIGNAYAILSILWFSFEGSIIKSTAKAVLKKDILATIYADAPTILAFTILFYSITVWPTFTGKIIATLLCLGFMTTVRYLSNLAMKNKE